MQNLAPPETVSANLVSLPLVSSLTSHHCVESCAQELYRARLFEVSRRVVDKMLGENPLSSSGEHPGSDSDSPQLSHSRGLFESTPWSEVLAAGDSSHEHNRSSLETLCRLYWPPLHSYVRRKVRDQHLAQDLTQSFFQRLLTGRSLRLADPARGRFRAFLIQAVEWHLANEFRDSKAIKRGGDVQTFTLDFSSSNAELTDDSSLTPEQLFDRDWALTLLNQTMTRLEQEQVAANKDTLFRTFKGFLAGSAQPDGYAAICETLGMTEPAARMAVSRLRNRYRELLREEIMRTVASSQDVEDEIMHLFRAISMH